MQETFASIWRSAAQLQARARAGRAVALRGRAQRDRRPRRAPAASRRSRPPTSASDEPGPAERAEAAGSSWRVHRALEELPEREREVLELAYWSGLSQSEIAEFLDIPLGTVKTRTRSALARLAGRAGGEELVSGARLPTTSSAATCPRRSASACAASTTCSCRRARRPSCRPALESRPVGRAAERARRPSAAAGARRARCSPPRSPRRPSAAATSLGHPERRELPSRTRVPMHGTRAAPQATAALELGDADGERQRPDPHGRPRPARPPERGLLRALAHARQPRDRLVRHLPRPRRRTEVS